MLKSFDQSALKAFLRSPLKARNGGLDGGKVQAVFLRPGAAFLGKGALHFDMGNRNPGFDGRLPDTGQPYRKWSYREVTGNYGEIVEVTWEIDRGSCKFTQTVSGVPTVHGSFYEAGYVGPPNVYGEAASNTTLDFDYDNAGTVLSRGHIHIELSLPYTQAEIYADLNSLMGSFNIDSAPYPGAGLTSIYDLSFNNMGQPDSFSNILLTDVYDQKITVSGNSTTTVTRDTFANTFAIGESGLPLTSAFECVVGCTSSVRVPFGPYPDYSQPARGFYEGFFVAGYLSYTDPKFGAGGGANDYRLQSSWNPVMARSRWRLSLANPIVLKANYTGDPRLTEILPGRQIFEGGIYFTANDFPFLEDYDFVGPLSYNKFSGELRLDPSVDRSGPAPSAAQVIFLPLFHSQGTPTYIGNPSLNAGLLGAPVVREDFTLS